MRLLLGTPALLWWLSDDPRLGERARDRIANPRNTVLVSAVSLWEITQAIRLGTLSADIREILQAVEDGSFTWLDLRPEHCRALRKLPRGRRTASRSARCSSPRPWPSRRRWSPTIPTCPA